MLLARAQIPLHLSGFWVPIINQDPLASGSLGAGLTLYPPALLSIYVHGQDICSTMVNGKCLDFSNHLRSIERFLGVRGRGVGIKCYSRGELGEGLGLSAALSIAYAVGLLVKSGASVSLNKAGTAAHYAEVVNMTGLGDVIAEIKGGGLVARVSPGPPGVGDIDSFPIRERVRVAVTSVGSLTTPKMLVEGLHKQFMEGFKAYENFMLNPSLESFLINAYTFSRRTGMLSSSLDEALKDKLKGLIGSGCVLGYFVKKSLLAIIHDASCEEEVLSELKDLGTIKLLTPYHAGTWVLYNHGLGTEGTPKV
ncbi:MAG: hypothetical protein B6U73_01875 [Desulfurococcales archaeon ex4484_204]|nr:MAG: hypothetical protein B6U73_01875 [Desulfurococcales archaeon ex4484_204]